MYLFENITFTGMINKKKSRLKFQSGLLYLSKLIYLLTGDPASCFSGITDSPVASTFPLIRKVTGDSLALE